MSNCELRIELDRENPVYQIGEKINCTIHVKVNKTVKCKGLVVEKGWETHGRGNQDSGGIEELTLFQGEWRPGEYQFPCSFKIDSGPLTYHGHYVNVDWKLLVRADIPWAIDPKASREIVIERNTDTRAGDRSRSELNKPINPDDGGNKPGAMVMTFLMFLVIGGIFVATGWKEDDLTGIIFGIIAILASLVPVYLYIHKYLAQRKLGKVDLHVYQVSLRPGDETEVSVNFTPKESIQVNRVAILLRGEEEATSGSGTRRKTHSCIVHKKEYELSEKTRLGKRLIFDRSVKIAIPEDAPHTFIASDNKILWKLVLFIDIEDWPDWTSSRRIEVTI